MHEDRDGDAQVDRRGAGGIDHMIQPLTRRRPCAGQPCDLAVGGIEDVPGGQKDCAEER